MTLREKLGLDEPQRLDRNVKRALKARRRARQMSDAAIAEVRRHLEEGKSWDE